MAVTEDDDVTVPVELLESLVLTVSELVAEFVLDVVEL